MIDNQSNCLSESLNIVRSNNSLWQITRTLCNNHYLRKILSKPAKSPPSKRLRPLDTAIAQDCEKWSKPSFTGLIIMQWWRSFCWGNSEPKNIVKAGGVMAVILMLGSITKALMMHLRRVRVGAMKVKVPPCTIGSRHPKVLWWEFFRTKLFQLDWSIEAIDVNSNITPVGRWRFQIQRELCTEYNSEQGRPPWWR